MLRRDTINAQYGAIDNHRYKFIALDADWETLLNCFHRRAHKARQVAVLAVAAVGIWPASVTAAMRASTEARSYDAPFDDVSITSVAEVTPTIAIVNSSGLRRASCCNSIAYELQSCRDCHRACADAVRVVAGAA